MVTVNVTFHAVRRARERFGRWVTSGDVKLDVHDALREGRYSSHRPRWIPPFRRGRKQGPQAFRFVWTEDQQRVYVVIKRSKRVIVVTALSSGDIPWE